MTPEGIAVPVNSGHGMEPGDRENTQDMPPEVAWGITDKAGGTLKMRSPKEAALMRK